jgi:hypothetical protein
MSSLFPTLTVNREAERIIDALAKAVLCAFEVDGRQYFLKCRNNETAENIVSVSGEGAGENHKSSYQFHRGRYELS